MADLIYLASPYRHKDVRIEHLRYEQSSIVAASMINDGFLIFAPILNSHHIYSRGLIKGDDSILEWDLKFLEHCQELWVLCLDGWINSVGVQTEISHAKDIPIPVRYYNFLDYTYALRP